MMRTVILLLTFMAGSLVALAQPRAFGLGLILGEPTGISAKGYIGNDRAIAGAIAWRLWRGNALHIHADHLYHDRGLIGVPRGSMPLYYGFGVRLRTWTGERYWHRGRYHDIHERRVDLGVRFPVGLAYEFGGAPLDIFVEVAPILDLLPDTRVEINGSIGMRYWF